MIHIAFDDPSDLVYALGIGRLALFALTWPKTVTDVVLQAHLEFASLNVFFRKVVAAVSNLMQFGHQPQHSLHALYGCVRPIVLRSILYDISRWKYPGKPFILNANPRIGLIVTKLDIELGLMLFDHRVLKKKGIKLI
jgi:hypothetical protein